MNFLKKTNETSFERDVKDSIKRNCILAKNNCKHGLPNEPDLVAYLIDGIPHDIYNSLKAYCPEMEFSVSGVFCHQKPYVTAKGSNKTCELGDLLIIYIEEQNNACFKCNSLLLQAKITDKKLYTPYSPGDLIQLELYSSWPEFEYTRAGSLTGTIRNINPKTNTLGAQYLLMQKDYKDEKLINTATPNKILSPNEKLSKAIVDLLTFRTGRTFEYTHPSEDDWTNMIWDLLIIANNSSYNRKSSGKTNVPRLTTAGDFYTPQMDFNGFDSVPFTDDPKFIPSIIIQGKSTQETYVQESLY